MSGTYFDPRNAHHRAILRRDLQGRIELQRTLNGQAHPVDARALAMVAVLDELLGTPPRRRTRREGKG